LPWKVYLTEEGNKHDGKVDWAKHGAKFLEVYEPEDKIFELKPPSSPPSSPESGDPYHKTCPKCNRIAINCQCQGVNTCPYCHTGCFGRQLCSCQGMNYGFQFYQPSTNWLSPSPLPTYIPAPNWLVVNSLQQAMEFTKNMSNQLRGIPNTQKTKREEKVYKDIRSSNNVWSNPSHHRLSTDPFDRYNPFDDNSNPPGW
jgi:hypothetical protein